MNTLSKLIIFLCLIPVMGRGQINLVNNPSFEQYQKCPNSFDNVKYANHWSPISDTLYSATDSLGNAICSPEFCHTCSVLFPAVSVPYNLTFYHYPHTGNGLMQVQMYYNENDTGEHYRRDYLQGRLKNILVAGKQYCVTFYTTLEQVSAYAIDHIGAYLDNGIIDTTTHCGMPETTHTPQVYGTSIINDTLNWVRIQGSFTAIGNEKFITIGNFFDNAHTDTLRVHSSLSILMGNDRFSWYLVDDVSVIATDAVANAGHDTTITPTASDSAFVGTNEGYVPCKWYKNGVLIDSNKSGFKVKPGTTSNYVMELDICGTVTRDTVKVTVVPSSIMNYELLMMNVRVYPNPATNELTITGAEGCVLSITDITGRVVLQNSATTQPHTLDISSLGKGVYFVEVIAPATGEKVVKRLLKE